MEAVNTDNSFGKLGCEGEKALAVGNIGPVSLVFKKYLDIFYFLIVQTCACLKDGGEV